MNPTRAYNEMVGLLLEREDRQKFEWAIGAMLEDGPRNIVVLLGAPRTGKTTLTKIVRKVLLSPEAGAFAPRVAFLSWDLHELPQVDDDMFVFVEALIGDALTKDSLIIKTTGDRVPVNKHYVLMREIDSELGDIAEHCIELYRELGYDYYNMFQENDR